MDNEKKIKLLDVLELIETLEIAHKDIIDDVVYDLLKTRLTIIADNTYLRFKVIRFMSDKTIPYGNIQK